MLPYNKAPGGFFEGGDLFAKMIFRWGLIGGEGLFERGGLFEDLQYS